MSVRGDRDRGDHNGAGCLRNGEADIQGLSPGLAHANQRNGSGSANPMLFSLIEQQRFHRDLGAKVEANGPRLQATPGHRPRPFMQLIGLLSDTRQRAAMLRRCLLNSGSRVTGGSGQAVRR